ncbi:Beta-1 [Mactra antiquata]
MSSREKQTKSNGSGQTGSSFLHSMSNTKVSIELLTDMRSTRSNRTSRKVILKASITSVILLSIAFIITYSVLLTYVSNKVPLMRHHDDSPKSKSGKRTKLVARPAIYQNNVLKFSKDIVVKWNVSDFDVSYIEKPNCNTDSKIIILITSSPENYQRRKSIRETWCKPSNYNISTLPWQCMFLIGQSSVHLTQTLLHREISRYQDIISGSYFDSYRNLTVKTMHGLDWLRRSCSVNYVLKTDDDVYVNTQLLYKLIENCTPENEVYIGLVTQSEERLHVIRNQDSKWFVSMEQYSLTHYPPYAVGMGYLLSMDVVTKFVSTSYHILPFANEDAYVGVLAYELDVKPLRSGRFILSGWGLRPCNFQYLVVIHHVTAEEQYKMFNINQNAFQTCQFDTNTLTWL